MRGPVYRDELRHQKAKLEDATLENVVKTAGILDGIMRNVASQLEEDAAEDEKPRIMWTRKGGRDSEKAKLCEFCNVAHYGKKCYAKMLTEGSTPEHWETMPAEQRKRIAERAEKKKPGCTANINVLICAMPAAVKMECKASFEMLIDTQAAPGHKFHFIRDAALMHRVESIEGGGQLITGVGSEMVIDKIGTAMFRDAGSGEVYMLNNCLFDPRLPENLINPSYIREQGGLFDSANQRLYTANQKIIDLTDNWTFTALALPQELMNSVQVPVHRAAAVQRGSHGKLHIEVDGLRGKQRAAFELTSARYNDPSLGRMRGMRSIADGVSSLVEKANEVNAGPLLVEPRP